MDGMGNNDPFENVVVWPIFKCGYPISYNRDHYTSLFHYTGCIIYRTHNNIPLPPEN